MKLTIAYIGNGKSTNRYHLPYVLQRKDLFRVKTIWGRRERTDWAAIDQVRYTTKLEDILEDKEIQVVIVTTPVTAHAEMMRKVISAGKHCVCEKPFTLSEKEAEGLFEYAQERHLMLQCYQNRRFDSDFLTLKSVAASGKLGEIYEVEMHFDYYRPEIPERTDQYTRADSFLYAHACHTLDQVISWLGKPDRVHYDVQCLLGKGRMNDYFDLDLFFGDCKVSVKSSYFKVKPRPAIIAYGRKGMFIKRDTDRQEFDLKRFYLPDHEDFGLDAPVHFGIISWADENGVIHEEAVPSIRGDYGCYYDALYQTLVNGKTPLVTKEQTLLQMKILEQGARLIEETLTAGGKE